MKLTSVEIHPTNSSDAVVLSFRDPGRSNPYSVKSMTGLDATPIVPKFYGGPGNSNDNFYNLVLQGRDIVILMKPNPNFALQKTYSDLRDDMYRIIASSRNGRVQLQFKNGTDLVAVISGFIAKFETTQFEKDQHVQLTIHCDDPMLRGVTPVVVNVAGLDPVRTVINDAKSTAPHGFDFEVVFTSGTSGLIIADPDDSSWAFEVIPSLLGGFLNGDLLHVSSDYSNKSIYINRGGTIINLGSSIIPGSIWPLLFPGDTVLSLTSLEAATFHWSMISYYPCYWGV